MKPATVRSRWAIAGVAAAVAVIAVVSSQHDFTDKASAWDIAGPGYYSYGPEPGTDNGELSAETLPPALLPSPEELERIWEETDRLHEQLLAEHPEPVEDDLPGFGAKNGGLASYEAQADFGSLPSNRQIPA